MLFQVRYFFKYILFVVAVLVLSVVVSRQLNCLAYLLLDFYVKKKKKKKKITDIYVGMLKIDEMR